MKNLFLILTSLFLMTNLLGQSLDFVKKQDHVMLNGEDLAPPWTIEVLLKKKDLTSYAHLLSSTDGESGIRFNTMAGRTSTWIKSKGKTNQSFFDEIPIGEWVHLAITCDGRELKLYTNGRNAPFSLPISIKAPLGRIGYNRESEKALNSEIDDLRIWNTVLPETSIRKYQLDAISDQHPEYDQLVHYYKFDEGKGNILYDAKGTLNGTVSGASFTSIKNKDIGIIKLTSPDLIAACFSKTKTITCQISNLGSTEIKEDFEIKYKVDSSEYVHQTIKASKNPILPSTILEVKFPSIELSRDENHRYEIIANLPGDENSTNDTLLFNPDFTFRFLLQIKDSIKNEIESSLKVWGDTTRHDTIRLNALVKAIWDTNKGAISSNSTNVHLELVEKINELEAGRNSDKYQSEYYAGIASSTQNNENFDKSIALAKNANYKEGVHKAYLENDIYIQRINVERLEGLLEAYEWAKEIDDLYAQQLAVRKLGEIYRFKGENEKADAYTEEGFRILESLGGYDQTLHNDIITYGTYRNRVNYLKTLEWYKKAEGFKTVENKWGLFEAIRNLYLQQNDLENALLYAKKSIKGLPPESPYLIDFATGYTGLESEYSSLIEIYIQLGDTTKARFYIDSVLMNNKKISDSMRVEIPVLKDLAIKINTFNAEIFYQQKRYKESINAYNKAIQIEEKYFNLVMRQYKAQGIDMSKTSMIPVAFIYHHLYSKLGKVYLKLGKPVEAIEACKKGYLFFEKYENLVKNKEACECLYEAYKGVGNSSQALSYLEKKLEIEKQQAPVETAKQLQSMQFEKQQLADSLAQVEKDLRTEMTFQAEIQQKNQTRNIAFGIGALILLLAAGLWSRLRFTKKAKVEIEKQKDRAEQSEKYKEQFLANMSHEIRTPMHAISGMTKILKRNQHAEDQKVYLNAIDQSSNNLLVILNDVLDLSKIEAGKIRLESIPMDPRAVMENVIDILKFKAEDKGLYLSANIAEDIPSLTVGDPNRLNQILLNLAGNAIKFTEKGTVKINLDKVEQEGKPQLQFTVEDTGVGIPKDQLERIFDSFEQGDKTLGKKFGGTGLGLHISKELIELQEGNIWVESEVGQGSRFIFTLPLIIGEGSVESQVTLSEEKLKAMGEEMAGLKILLAEDNDFNALVATDDLSYYIPDVKIEHVENGLDALSLFQKGKYDMILMDMQMPEMNGFEASERIRVLEKELEDRTPIIAMTASLLKAEIQQCFDAGMDNYIPKPYKAEELIGRIYEEVKK